MPSPVIPLRRNLRFQTFWTGSVSATLGQAVGDIAYPLAIVAMTGSPGKAALFSAVQIAGMIVAGLPVGSLADRYDSQRLALVAHGIRTVVACVVAIALAGGWLTLPLLVAAAVVLGAGQSLGGAVGILLLRSIVPGEQLTLALTQDEVRINGASLAGPALAGALYGLHHVAPFTFTAAAFFVALTATAFLPAHTAGSARPAGRAEPAGPGGRAEPAGPGGRAEAAGPGGKAEPAGPGGKAEPAGPGGKAEPAGPGGKAEPAGPGGKAEPAGPGGKAEPAGPGGKAEPARPAGSADTGKRPQKEEPADGDILAGIRELWGQPLLRTTVLLVMCVNTVGAGLDLVIIVILRHQAVPAYAIGLALGIGAAGGLAGAPLVRLLHRLPPGVLILAACGMEVPYLLLLAVPLGPWWAAGILFSSMLSVPSLRVLGDILIIRQAPPERRGRVVAAVMTLIALGMPVGIAGCGLLLQYLTAQTAMVALAAAMATVTAYGLSRPEIRRARWPEARPEGRPETETRPEASPASR